MTVRLDFLGDTFFKQSTVQHSAGFAEAEDSSRNHPCFSGLSIFGGKTAMKIQPVIFATLAACTALIFTAVQPARADYSGRTDVSYCSTTLRANNPKSKISVRQGPGLNYKILHYGFSGDFVDIFRATPGGDPNQWAAKKDSQGYFWYKVGFRKSRATGWIRGDLLKFPPIECRN
jgi:hypothetical protein